MPRETGRKGVDGGRSPEPNGGFTSPDSGGPLDAAEEIKERTSWDHEIIDVSLPVKLGQ
jgi:hypothetical protein